LQQAVWIHAGQNDTVCQPNNTVMLQRFGSKRIVFGRVAVAALAGRTPLAHEQQEMLLAASQRTYPDVAGFRSLDLAGRVIAAVGVPVQPQELRGLAASMTAERDPRVQIRIAPAGNRSLTGPNGCAP